MAVTIFQHFIFKEFILPFLLIFTIVFAILEKTKILGDGKKQLDAIVAFVIGLIFVSVAYPKSVVNNLILFLTVALVIVFIVLMLWGFVSQGEIKILENKTLKWILGIAVILVVIIAVIWATGMSVGFLDLLFKQTWSKTFWTNVFFIAVVAFALALVLKKSK